MQLHFLGQAYTPSSPAIEVTETEETAQFIGQAYTRKEYRVEQPELPPEELIYRGQRYVRQSSGQPSAYKPRPGEVAMNGRQLLQLQRSRTNGRRHPAFRGS